MTSNEGINIFSDNIETIKEYFNDNLVRELSTICQKYDIEFNYHIDNKYSVLQISIPITVFLFNPMTFFESTISKKKVMGDIYALEIMKIMISYFDKVFTQ